MKVRTPIYPCNSSSGRVRGELGYTLLELLIVLAIVALCISISAASISTRSHERRLVEAEMSSLIDVLTDAHRQAIKHQRVVIVQFDRSSRRLSIDGRDVHQIPEDLDFSMVGVNMEANRNALEIGFFPGGGSTGGYITIGRANSSATLSVDWLTGGVRASTE